MEHGKLMLGWHEDWPELLENILWSDEAVHTVQASSLMMTFTYCTVIAINSFRDISDCWSMLRHRLKPTLHNSL